MEANHSTGQPAKTIGILGIRGIPARYGGFETVAEALAVRLHGAGFRVIVACERIVGDSVPPVSDHRGIRLFYFPVNPSLRPFSEILYDIRSLITLSRKCDILYMFGYGAGFSFWIAKLFGKKLVVNCDGMEWMRRKWGRISRSLLRLNERLGLMVADRIVVDSVHIAEYINRRHERPTVFLPYGVDNGGVTKSWNASAIEKWHGGWSDQVSPGEYYLVLARLEPDNNIDTIIQGFSLSKTSRKLLIVGPCESARFYRRLQEIARSDSRVLLAGPVYDPDLKAMLRSNCGAYIHGHVVGGTNPSLLESLAAGNVILAADVTYNREVIGDGDGSAFFFRPEPDSLAQLIDRVDPSLPELQERAQRWGRSRIETAYNWKKIVEKYQELFSEL